MILWVEGEITPLLAHNFGVRVAAYLGNELTIVIDSNGGDVDSACWMGLAIQEFEGLSEAYVLRAESAALLTALAADHVVAAKDATGLLHSARSKALGSLLSPELLRAAAEHTEHTNANVAKFLERKTTEPASFWRMLMAFNQRLTAEHMAGLGLVYEVSLLSSADLRDKYRPAARRRSRPRPAEIKIDPEALAEWARLSRNSLRYVQAAHFRTGQMNPTEVHNSDGREPYCCNDAYFEVMARRQLQSAESALLRLQT